jgi:hypothetical protein
MSPAVPTATRTPRTRILLKLLSDRVGLWIPAQEMAEIIGPQHEVYIPGTAGTGPIHQRTARIPRRAVTTLVSTESESDLVTELAEGAC